VIVVIISDYDRNAVELKEIFESTCQLKNGDCFTVKTLDQLRWNRMFLQLLNSYELDCIVEALCTG